MQKSDRNSNTPSSTVSAMRQFQHGWQTYRKVVDNDYLSHRGAYAMLHEHLVKHRARPFRFLDLACGDAGSCAEALSGTQVSHYLGVDLSGPALQLARQHLAALPCQVELVQADFARFVHDFTGPVDVVWVGLSLHHLDTEEKQRVFQAARRIIQHDGVMLIYEPTLADGETRAQFMHRTEGWVQAAWTALSPAERSEILGHMLECDFPEPAGGWKRLAAEAGFKISKELFVDPSGMYRVYRFVS